MHRLRAETSQLFADNFSNAVVDADSPQMKIIEDLCRANLEENVTDPELLEKLRPNYRAACTRLVISPDFYPAIQKPNADLVRSGHCREISAAAAATARFDAERVEAAKKTVWATGCHSWYLDDRGIPAAWPWTFDRFREEVAAPQPDAYELVG